MKSIKLMTLLMLSSQAFALDTNTCIRPAGHFSKVCGNITFENNHAVINNLSFKEGSLGSSFYFFLKPHQFTSSDLCTKFLTKLNKTFETSSKEFGTVWEMYETKSGRTGCRGHKALYRVKCENVSDLNNQETL